MAAGCPSGLFRLCVAVMLLAAVPSIRTVVVVEEVADAQP